MNPLPPGATIGILGSGQLGRMLILAAARLGFKCHVYADAPGPAFDVAAATTIGAYDDEAALATFAAAITAATFEFENIPEATVAFLSSLTTVRPGAKALACAQDRMNEKRLARALGAQTANFAAVDTLQDLRRALAELGTPAILKTRRFGYDGKGQIPIKDESRATEAWSALAEAPAILEAFVPFTAELSIVAVRSAAGQFAAYDVATNEHRDGILFQSHVPTKLSLETCDAATATTKAIADALDYVGVIAVEFFVQLDGGKETLFVNEIAPRVHNSGHWTIDACAVSQFENHIRAVAGWPLGSTGRHSNAVMTNLIGQEAQTWKELAAEANACLHLYGKRDARPGRKMGHVTHLTARSR